MPAHNFAIEMQFSETAHELESWFKSIVQLTDDTIFAIGRDKPYQDAVLLGVLTENARVIWESTLGEQGKLYTPICLILAALTKRLKIMITPDHWKAAIENVYTLTRQLEKAQTEAVGIYLGTPATIFKSQLCETLGNAGLLTRPTILDVENRRIATGLSINWGIRFLIAYALETCKHNKSRSKAQDIYWIGSRIQTAMNHCSV